MAGWKALKKDEREYVKGILRTDIAKWQQYAGTDPKTSERKISVLAIAIDVLDKACPPDERSGPDD